MKVMDLLASYFMLIVLIFLMALTSCGTEEKRSSVGGNNPNSIVINQPDVTPVPVEVCNKTKLTHRRIRRYLCNKSKNKKACKRKVNKLIRRRKDGQTSTTIHP